jgi:hypothetical protein
VRCRCVGTPEWKSVGVVDEGLVLCCACRCCLEVGEIGDDDNNDDDEAVDDGLEWCLVVEEVEVGLPSPPLPPPLVVVVVVVGGGVIVVNEVLALVKPLDGRRCLPPPPNMLSLGTTTPQRQEVQETLNMGSARQGNR